MPYISVECGTLTDEQKGKLIRRLTEKGLAILDKERVGEAG